MNPHTVGGYEQFFGLRVAPFSLAPDPRFLFASASHSAALAEIAYAIDRREPIVVVTGEIGTGKTLLCRTMLQRLPGKTFVSVVSDPLLGPEDLLRQLLQDFGVISRDWAEAAAVGRHDLANAMHGFLRSLGPLQAHAVVIVDEAQHLQPGVLEQIRLLANVDDERGTLLQIVLVGQTDVEPLLSRPELRQLRQRVSRRYRLEPLTHDEVRQYVEHRLARGRDGAPATTTPGAAELARALAEWEDTPPAVFEPGTFEALATITGGVPRLINLICDRALESAFADGTRTIDVERVHATARALELEAGASPEPVVPAAPAPAVAPPTPEPAAPHEDLGEWHDFVETLPAPAAAEDTPEIATAMLGDAPPRSRRGLATAAIVIALAGAAAWVGVRFVARNPAGRATAAAAGQMLRTPARGAVPSGVTPANSASPAGGSTPSAPAVAPPPTTTSARATPEASSDRAVAPAAAAGSFELVVASFKTEARAAEVQGAIAHLDLPVRVRAVGAWQQVICGPFASRPAADEAQQKLTQAGFAGAQVVAAAR